MKNTKALLLLCLPFLAVTACDYAPSPVNPSSIESIPSEGQSTSEVDPYFADRDVWKRHFDTFDAFYIDQNYSLEIHITGELDDGEKDDWTTQLTVANYAARRASWEADESKPEDEDYKYLVSSASKTQQFTFEADEVSYYESQGKWVSEDTYTIHKEEFVQEYVLPLRDYDKFTYDTEEHIFRTTADYMLDYGDTLLGIHDTWFQFYEGKLVKGEMNIHTDGDKKEYKYEYNLTFGGVKFDVPDYEKI